MLIIILKSLKIKTTNYFQKGLKMRKIFKKSLRRKSAAFLPITGHLFNRLFSINSVKQGKRNGPLSLIVAQIMRHAFK